VLSNFTDLGMKQILLAQCYNLKNICLHQFKIHIKISFPATGFFLPGLAENSWQDSFNNFLQMQHKNNFQFNVNK
jgi:hypothetical protein